MHREALPSFQPRERLCLGRGSKSVLSGKHRDAYQSLLLAGSTDTVSFYSITMKAFAIQEVEFYNIDGVF